MATGKKTNAVAEVVEHSEPKFSKEQILASEKFANRRDLVDALLKDKCYTITEVDDLINKYMKGKVN